MPAMWPFGSRSPRIDLLADPGRLGQLDMVVLDD
jgi:hypothetical protein